MPIRIGGLASGMDIDKLVADLMKAERMPLDKLTAKKQTFEWSRDAYRGVNKQFKDFDDYLFKDLRLEGSFQTKKATSSDDSAVGVKANPRATGTLTVESVTQLAAGPAASLGSVSAADLEAKMGTAGSFTISTKLSDGKETKTEIAYKADDTLADVVDRLNGAKAGVTLFVNKSSQAGAPNASLTSAQVGEQTVAVSGADGAAFFSRFGLGADADGTLLQGGQNAKLKVNGLDIEKTSNSFDINGFALELKQATTAPVTLTASSDVSSMMDKIKGFVEKYNALVDGLKDKTGEEKFKKYTPLTEEQRAAMKSDEIEKWEDKAKSGLLRNDSILTSAVEAMRGSFGASVAGMTDKGLDSLVKIGVKPISSWREGGKLEIDEDKLRQALEANPDQVMKLFTNSGEKTATDDSRGIAQRLRDAIKTTVTAIEKKAGKASMGPRQFEIGKALTDNEQRIDAFQERLKAVEERYWRQFGAMEKAISKGNAQSGWLAQQFGQ